MVLNLLETNFSNAHFKIHERSLDLKLKSKCKYSCKQQLRGQAQQRKNEEQSLQGRSDQTQHLVIKDIELAN